ncbi:hypothetical protein AC579_8929 [Pseudocercospora musae]|uniref:F-box domain-containing protein n=1 Tax=Pseudocercospora musae TaxID=113226 RepID=A0A139GT90_9PEZI|nr:hypothetical protein AC579_8929 [Pseudocercospora musae]
METFCVHDPQRDCVICYTEASGPDILLFSRDRDPRQLHLCRLRTNVRRHGYFVHRSCLEMLKRSTATTITDDETVRRLGHLAHSLSFLWPVSKVGRSTRSRRIALDAGHHYARFAERLTTGTPLHSIIICMLRLPVELQHRILELSDPCTLLKLCTLWRVANHLISATGLVNSPKQLSLSSRLHPIRRGILGHQYIGEVLYTSDTSKGTMTVAYDDVGCLSLGYNSKLYAGSPSWYRIIPSEFQKDLLIYYKGEYIQDIFSKRFFQECFLWDCINPPVLSPLHCYGLPARDMSLTEATETPVRLRRIELSAATTAIAVACTGGSTIGFQAYSRPCSTLDYYDRIEGLMAGDKVTWLYYPLYEGETIVEVSVRGFPNADYSTLWYPSLLLFTSYDRCLVLGPHVIPELRPEYEFRRLLNKPGREVSAIYLNERNKSTTPMRIGITCRQSVGPRSFSWNPWGKEVPTTSPPTSARVDPWYFSKADLSLYESFQMCTDESANARQCLGILLHSRRESKVLGEWRWDRDVSSRTDLPTSKVLVNISEGKTPGVYISANNVYDSLSSVRISGVLEWWSGPKGAAVSPALVEDPFVLLS